MPISTAAASLRIQTTAHLPIRIGYPDSLSVRYRTRPPIRIAYLPTPIHPCHSLALSIVLLLSSPLHITSSSAMHAQMIFAHVRALVGSTARVRGCGRPIQDRLSAGYPGAVCGFCSPPRSRSQTARAAACADVCGTAARGAAFLRFLALPMLDRLRG